MAAALSTEELKLVYRGVNVGDLARVFTLEEASYPSDEGASEETLRFRIANAADYFVVACMDPKECMC